MDSFLSLPPSLPSFLSSLHLEEKIGLYEYRRNKIRIFQDDKQHGNMIVHHVFEELGEALSEEKRSHME